METELKTIENFWSSLVKEEGLASYLLSSFKVSHDDEVKALALLTRVTFLLTIGMKNDRDDSIKNQEHLWSEIMKIKESCSNKTCCQKTKLSIDNLLQNFKQSSCQPSYMTTTSHDVFTEEFPVTDSTKSKEKVDYLFNRPTLEKNSHPNKMNQPCKILALETQKMEACLPRENISAIPETISIESSQDGKIFEQYNEDFNKCSARKYGDENLEEELGNGDDVLLSPILGKKQTAQRKTNNEGNCSFNDLFSSPEKLIVGNKIEKPACELSIYNHISLNNDFQTRHLTPRLDIQIDGNHPVDQSTASASRTAKHLSSDGKSIDSQVKRSLDFCKSPSHELFNGQLGSNMNDLSSNNIGKHTSKLPTPNHEYLSNSPSLLACRNSLSPQIFMSPQIGIPKESFDSSKFYNLMSTPCTLSNLGQKNSESSKQNHNVSMSEESKSSSDIICSKSPNQVDEQDQAMIIDFKNMHKPKIKKASSLRRHKSAFCTRSTSEKTRMTPLSRTTTAFNSSKIKAEFSFMPNSKNVPKKMLKQTTLTQDCFVMKTNKIISSNNSKELHLMDKNDLILNAAIEESLKTKETEDMLRKKKDQLKKVKEKAKVNLSAIEVLPAEEFEGFMRSSPVEVTKVMPQYRKDGNLSSSLRRSPRKHHLLINSMGNNLENKIVPFNNKLTCSISKWELELGNSLNAKEPKAKWNEEEILAQLEGDSLELKEKLPLNNSFKSKKLHIRHEKIKAMEDSFDLVPPKMEEPTYAYKGSVIRKKSEKHKVEGWECHECKDYFHAKGLTEEQKKLVLNQCSRHRSMHKHVTNTPKGFWNANWDSINECNETCFEYCSPQNESKAKKKESVSECYEASLKEDGRRPKNMKFQNTLTTLKDEKRKSKTEGKHQFTDAEFDAIGVNKACNVLKKAKNTCSKDLEIKSTNVASAPLKWKSSSLSDDRENDSPYEEGRIFKRIKNQEVKKNKTKRKHSDTDTYIEFDSVDVFQEGKKKKKENIEHAKETKLSKIEIKLVEKENVKEKKVANTQLQYLEEGWIQTRSSKL